MEYIFKIIEDSDATEKTLTHLYKGIKLVTTVSEWIFSWEELTFMQSFKSR